MRARPPDAHWLDFIKAVETKTAPKDPFVLEIYQAYTGEKPNTNNEYACDLARDASYREPLVAFFLSGASPAEISESLGIPEDVVTLFGKLVIDLSAFRNKLELLKYAASFREGASENGQRLIEMAISQGPIGLIYHFLHGHEELSIDVKRYARTMMQQAFYYGMLARGNSIKSGVAKESLKWVAATANLIRDYDRIVGDIQDSDEALLEIEKRKMTSTPYELGVELEDILH